MGSHLFWSGASKATDGKPTKDSKKVLDCLKKGLKIAKQCMDPLVQVQLFVEILNHYVLFYEAGCESISLEMLSEMIKILTEELAGLEQTDDSQQIRQHCPAHQPQEGGGGKQTLPRNRIVKHFIQVII